MNKIRLDKQLIEELAEAEGGEPLLSVYLPTTAQPGERKKNRIRLKNALSSLREQLLAAGVEAEATDRRLEALNEFVTARGLGSHGDAGVAILDGAGKSLFLVLPGPVSELAIAAPGFHLKPLIAAQQQGRYLLLCLSQNDVRLYEGDATGLEAIQLGQDVPRSLADAVGHDIEEKQLQQHASSRGSTRAIFHGHGTGKDDTDAEVVNFLRQLDDALRDRFLNGLPLVLAGVRELTADYRRLSKYDNIHEAEISGNVDDLAPAALHDKAWPAISEVRRRQQLDELRELVSASPDNPVSSALDEIVLAAGDGRIARLFVAADRERWGRVDSEQRDVVGHEQYEPGDCDLLDHAAAEAFCSGAEVLVLPADDMAGAADAIAAMRYEVA